VRASGKGKILEALDDLAAAIRRDLGESLDSIAERETPLPRATTSSLEALHNYALGERATRNRRWDEAEAFYSAAIELDSSFALAHAKLGEIYYWQGKKLDGEAHFEIALELLNRVTMRERLWLRGFIEGIRGNRDAAIRHYRSYLGEYPDDVDAMHRLGYVFMMSRRCDEATVWFKRVLKHDPYSSSSYINIATCYSKMLEHYEDAITNYIKAFELQPSFLTSGNLNHEFGFTYVCMGRIEEAEDVFRKMLTGDTMQKAGGRRSLALLKMYLGRYSEAAEELNEAILLCNADGVPLSEARNRLFLVVALQAKGKTEAASEELHEISVLLQTERYGPYWLSIAGKIHARNGDIEQATRYLEEISRFMNEESHQDRATFNLLKGEVELANGHHAEAVDLLEIALTLREDNYWRESLAHAYLLSGDLDRSAEIYGEIISEKDLGWEAQECWLDAFCQLGKIYEKRGDDENAKRCYEQLLQIWHDADSDLLMRQDVSERLTKLKQRR